MSVSNSALDALAVLVQENANEEAQLETEEEQQEKQEKAKSH